MMFPFIIYLFLEHVYSCASEYFAFKSNFIIQFVHVLSDSAYLIDTGKSGETHVTDIINLPLL